MERFTVRKQADGKWSVWDRLTDAQVEGGFFRRAAAETVADFYVTHPSEAPTGGRYGTSPLPRYPR